MSTAVASSLGIVGYLTLFAVVGFVFLFVNLLLGRFFRPDNPQPEKLEVYECGEPSVGSAYVQFDLRFYVVALLFIIFDVEVAFFFPWATVFGKSMHLAALADQQQVVVDLGDGNPPALTPAARSLYREMGVRSPLAPTVELAVPPRSQGSKSQGSKSQDAASQGSDAVKAATAEVKHGARQLAWVTMADIGLFFAVLMVGFAYVWKRGDLDWVRAVARERLAAS